MKNGITFGGKPTRDQKMAIAEALLARTNKDTAEKPKPQWSFSARPTAGLRGLKATAKYEW
mgnify:CR=1 FL=1